MKTTMILAAAFLLIEPALAQLDHLPEGSANIEDRRVFWNGYWGDRAKGEDTFNGEVHGWVHPHSTIPVDPYPHPDTRKFFPPWWEAKVKRVR